MHAARPAVSRMSNRDYIAWAANKPLDLTAPGRARARPSRAVLSLTRACPRPGYWESRLPGYPCVSHTLIGLADIGLHPTAAGAILSRRG